MVNFDDSDLTRAMTESIDDRVKKRLKRVGGCRNPRDSPVARV